MLVTISWIEKNYNKFNNLYFGGTLPKIQFKTSRSRNTWGFASYKYDFVNNTIIPLSITLSNYYDSPEDVKISTLLHEMIHIEDYMWHPEHFICNGKKVRKNYYDAHGIWFVREASRITIESGYNIATHVTKSEIVRSCLSVKSQRLMNNKITNARIVAASNGISVWYFKTDTSKVHKVINLIKYHIPEYNYVSVYSFDNENLANRRSCNNKLSGWHVSKPAFMRTAEKYAFTTIKNYKL